MAVLLNQSTSPRVFFLRSGVNITIAPGELYLPTLSQEEDVKILIKSKMFRKLMDLGFMAVSNKKSDILRAQQTPVPPSTLNTTKHVAGTGIVVSANQDAEFNANPEQTMKIIGSAEV
jgi:hypothetical protein